MSCLGIAQLSAAKLKEMQHPIVVAYEEVDGKVAYMICIGCSHAVWSIHIHVC